MTLVRYSTRCLAGQALIEPLTYKSHDGIETPINYNILVDSKFLEPPNTPKGIILETYGAIDNSESQRSNLAEQGYIVINVFGHTLAQQEAAEGARSTVKDMAFFASLIKGNLTIQTELEKADSVTLSPNQEQDTALRRLKSWTKDNSDLVLTDCHGNRPLSGFALPKDLPVIMTGSSQGGDITLNIASSVESFDCLYQIHSQKTGSNFETTFYNRRYDEAFDAFVAESPWFRKQEEELHTSKDTEYTETYATTSSWSRADIEKTFRKNPLLAKKNPTWMHSTDSARKNQIENYDNRMDPLRSASNIRKPICVIQSQLDDNTPTIFTAQFAEIVARDAYSHAS